ncbi:MAG: ribose 5-phosphate isomerase B [Candidatus Margulisiibacteriota bacterium]
MVSLVLGSDHGGFELKERLKQHLIQTHPEVEVVDLGTHSTASVDYPDFAKSVAHAILGGKAALGVLVCGTGIGISIAANRFDGIRAALVHNAFTAEMAKAHNNANVLCLGGRTTEPDLACQLVDIWLKTPFEGGRHQGRLDKLRV